MAERRATRIVRFVAIAAAALVFLWFCTSITAAFVLTRGDPERAVAAWPIAEAQATQAAIMMARPATVAETSRARGLAEAALRRSPVDALAARALALSYAQRGDSDRGRRIISYGERLSRRDMPTQLWLIEDAVGRGDVTGALVHYDRAMRTSVEIRDIILPVLVSASDDPAIAQSVGTTIRSRPEWWSDFTGRYSEKATDPVAIATLIGAMRFDLRRDIDREYLQKLLTRMAQIGGGARAHALAAKALGRGATPLVADGGFEGDAALQPFAWTLIEGADRAAFREQRDGATGDLALTVTGTVGGEVARQMVVLSRGTYRLVARVANVGGATGQRPVLQLYCASGEPRRFGEIELPAVTAPTTVGFDFTVADDACSAQWLVVRGGSGVSLSEPIWIDDVRIERRGGAAATR